MPDPSTWPQRLRETPTGILLISAFLVVLGFGSLFGGLWVVMSQGDISYWAIATGVIGGPALFYLAYNLIHFARWTWMTLIALIVLMAASSVLRLLVDPGMGIAPTGELLVEAIAAYYLTRPSIRRRFSEAG